MHAASRLAARRTAWQRREARIPWAQRLLLSCFLFGPFDRFLLSNLQEPP